MYLSKHLHSNNETRYTSYQAQLQTIQQIKNVTNLCDHSDQQAVARELAVHQFFA